MIIEMPKSRPDEPYYARECEHSLYHGALRLKDELATLFRSERRAAEELAGAMVLPAEYPLGASFISFLASRALTCGWETATVHEALPNAVALATVPVLEGGSNEASVFGDRQKSRLCP